MKPPSFVYRDPETIEAALDLLAEWGDEGKVLAGGQSLVPILNFRLARPSALIDINRIGELAGIEALVDTAYPSPDRRHPTPDARHPTPHTPSPILRIGALTRHSEVERSGLVRQACPLLAEAVPHIGHRQIRNRGTFGGSLAHADPAAELPLVATVLAAEIRSRRGDQVAAHRPEAFFQGYLTTALAPDELLTEIILPAWPAGAGSAFLEVSPRQGDFALVSVAAIVQLDEGGRVRLLRLGLGGCAPAPRRIAAAESLATGRAIDAALLADLVDAVQSDIEPDSDIHASAEYRRDVAATLARRAVREAARRAVPTGNINVDEGDKQQRGNLLPGGEGPPRCR